MDRKERSKKFDENLTIFFAAIGMIAVFVLVLFGIIRIPLCASILLLITPFTSLIILKKGIDIYSPKDAVNIILALGVVCIFCLIAIHENNGKDEAYLNKLIYGGTVKKEKRFVEGDGETVDHYESFYVYKPQNGDGNFPSEFIHYFLLIISWGAPIAHWFLFVAASKKFDPNKKS